MAAGDIKDERAVVVELTAGEAIAKGQVVHFETADDKYDIAVSADVGKFAVAIEAAAADEDKFRAVIWGPVEVTAAAAIGKAELVMSATAGKVIAEDWGVNGETIGTAMEAFASGGVQTIWVGLVG